MGWITENVLWQQPGENLGRVVSDLAQRTSAPRNPGRILHLLNPYSPTREDDRHVHRLTLDSISAARREFSGETRLIAAVEAADAEQGAGFDDCLVIETDNGNTPTPPRLFDVLLAGGRSRLDGDIMVFSNMDICVDNGFYTAVQHLLTLGVDALIINRRTVHGWDVGDPSARLARFDLGHRHPGLDCFVFRRSWLEQFVNSDARIGYAHVMRSLLYNLIAIADPLVMLTESGMTYHYGDDQPWNTPAGQSWYELNRSEARATYGTLAQHPDRRARLAAFVDALPVFRP